MSLPTEQTNLNFLRNLEEDILLEIEVSCSPQNPIFKSFLFKGFNTGGYWYIFNNTHDVIPVNIRENGFSSNVYYLKVIKKLADLK